MQNIEVKNKELDAEVLAYIGSQCEVETSSAAPTPNYDGDDIQRQIDRSFDRLMKQIASWMDAQVFTPTAKLSFKQNAAQLAANQIASGNYKTPEW